MNKAEFIAAMAELTTLSKKDCEKAVAAYHDLVTETLQKGDKVTFVGFGSYEVKSRAARTGRNPRTGDAISIAASKVPAFSPGAVLKAAVNKK